ncbi:MAG: aldo/keto reductase [Phycisphaerales bacterium]|nr:aldo/keto reductase [Phycisphaerales bacterium]
MERRVKTAQLERRPLGNTGLVVSPIGLGTVKLGRNLGVKYPGGEGYPLPSDHGAAELLRTAADLGVNLIDTAPAYGTSEERLGRLLGRGGVPARNEWVIVTKAGEEFEGGVSRFDFSRAAVRASVERSLRRLGTEIVDAVLLHSDGRDEWVIKESGAAEELARLKETGLVRAIGISTKTASGGVLAAACGVFDLVMLTYNLHERGDLPAIKLAAERGVGVLVKKALASGHLALSGAAEQHQTSERVVRDAMRFVLITPGVGSVVVGTTNPAHLRQNVEAARVKAN